VQIYGDYCKIGFFAQSLGKILQHYSID